MKSIAACLGILLIGCEHFPSIDQEIIYHPQMTRQCIEKAIRATAGVKFVEFKEVGRDSLCLVGDCVKFSEQSHYLILESDKSAAAVMVMHIAHGETLVTNHAGYRDLSELDKKKLDQALRRVTASIQKLCH